MFCIKYKVRRNDTSATTDLASTLSAPQGVVGRAACQLYAMTVPMFIGDGYLKRKRKRRIDA
jgi:hypothetical protein